jgi:phage baseplate assembly protein V
VALMAGPRLSDAIARIIIRAVNAAGKTQLWQFEDEAPDVDDNEDLHETESIQHFGFASNPPLGSEAIAVNVAADGDHAVIIASQHKDYQPTGLAEGEVALYTKDGVKVHCKADGITYIGDAPTDAPPLDSKLQIELTAIRAELTKIVTTLGTGSNSGGAVVFGTPYVNGYSVGTTTATEIKIK